MAYIEYRTNELRFKGMTDLIVSFEAQNAAQVNQQTNTLIKSIGNAGASTVKFADAQEKSADASAVQILALQQMNQAATQLARSLQGFAQQATSELISYDDALTAVSARSKIAKEDLGFLTDAVQEVALTTSQSPVSALKTAGNLIALGASAEQAAERLRKLGRG